MKNMTIDNGLAKADISFLEPIISKNLFLSKLEEHYVADKITDLSKKFSRWEESTAFTQDLRGVSFLADTLVGG